MSKTIKCKDYSEYLRKRKAYFREIKRWDFKILDLATPKMVALAKPKMVALAKKNK